MPTRLPATGKNINLQHCRALLHSSLFLFTLPNHHAFRRVEGVLGTHLTGDKRDQLISLRATYRPRPSTRFWPSFRNTEEVAQTKTNSAVQTLKAVAQDEPYSQAKGRKERSAARADSRLPTEIVAPSAVDATLARVTMKLDVEKGRSFVASVRVASPGSRFATPV